MQKLVAERLPEITPEVSRFLKGTLDFVGINHYTTLYVRNDRMKLRKLILQDASTDSAVITTCKMPSILDQFFFFRATMLWTNVIPLFVSASKHGVAIGDRVCLNLYIIK